MLNIFYGDMKEAVYNTASYFKYDYEEDWIVDPMVKEMIQDVDRSTDWFVWWRKDPDFGKV